MPELTDHELLADFARSESEEAFATLVARYVNLVYSAAVRFTGNSHHAEEITQAVFIILAQKAAKLSSGVVLSGWLYQTTRLTAANFMKAEIRRQRREQEAYMQSTLNEPGSAAWQQIAPLLEDAMGRLGETDRNAVVLRFFENKTAAEAAAILKLTEAATHKRTLRALDKLRKFFSKHGVVSTTVIIAEAISTHSTQVAPAALVNSTTVAVIAKGVSMSTLTLVKGTLKVMAWAKAKMAITAGVTLATTAGLAIVAVQRIEANGRATKTPAFAAEGFISSIFYRNALNTNDFLKTEGKVLFLYSNDVWRVQFTYTQFEHPNLPLPDEKIIGQIIDEKRIPDGTRQVIVFSPGMEPNPMVTPSSIVESNQYPSSGSHGLFMPWLSLCPNPELPLTASNRMHFVFEPKQYANPRNEGGFVAHYIEPEKEFLSELIITNSGAWFSSDGKTFDYPEPYQNGFVGFTYKVLETTNCHGIRFPLKAVMSRFTPAPNGKSPDELVTAGTVEFSIQQIDVGGRHLAFAPIPERVLALDHRPPGLNQDFSMNYMVTNDQYFALSNKRMEQLANIYRRSFANRKPAGARPQ